MKYNIGDKLLIKSKIMPYDSITSVEDASKWVRVCTSENCGWDRFFVDKIDKTNDYVYHEVVVVRIDSYSNSDGIINRQIYIVKNLDESLSVYGKFSWQGCSDIDVVKKL